MTPARLALGLCVILATQAQAKDPREAYECSVMLACTVAEPCRDDDGSNMPLAFVNDLLEVNYAGFLIAVPYDRDLRTAAWRMGDIVMQLRFTGDGSGVILVTPEFGDFERTQVQTFHCSPE